jgi:hypothetical protein
MTIADTLNAAIAELAAIPHPDDLPEVQAAYDAYDAAPANQDDAAYAAYEAAYAAAEAAQQPQRQAIQARIDAAREALRTSDEPRIWVWRDLGGAADFTATDLEDATESTRETFDAGAETYWVHGRLTCEATGEEEDVSFRVDPAEPDCCEAEHDWRAPFSVVGGIKENPGVWGHGGGAVCKEVCAHCGAYRITDTWAQDPETGEQGLTSVEYQTADGASLAWVERRKK